MQDPIQLEIEIPDPVYKAIQAHLDKTPGWDINRLGTAALSLYLLQQPGSLGQPEIARAYLDALFGWEKGEAEKILARQLKNQDQSNPAQ